MSITPTSFSSDCGAFVLPGFHRPGLSDSYAGCPRSEKTVFTLRIPPWNWKVSALPPLWYLILQYTFLKILSYGPHLVVVHAWTPIRTSSVSTYYCYIQTDVSSDLQVYCLILFFRPPERRHGYEQSFHSITTQHEHEALEAKRPRMETVAEVHISRTPPAAGSIVLPMPHTVQDSLRATVEVKKVGNLSLKIKKWLSFLFFFLEPQSYLVNCQIWVFSRTGPYHCLLHLNFHIPFLHDGKKLLLSKIYTVVFSYILLEI